jgi:hypothetical protein
MPATPEQSTLLFHPAVGRSKPVGNYGEEFWRTKSEENVGNVMASAFAPFARGEALDYQVREQSQDVCAIDVTGMPVR